MDEQDIRDMSELLEIIFSRIQEMSYIVSQFQLIPELNELEYTHELIIMFFPLSYYIITAFETSKIISRKQQLMLIFSYSRHILDYLQYLPNRINNLRDEVQESITNNEIIRWTNKNLDEIQIYVNNLFDDCHEVLILIKGLIDNRNWNSFKREIDNIDDKIRKTRITFGSDVVSTIGVIGLGLQPFEERKSN